MLAQNNTRVPEKRASLHATYWGVILGRTQELVNIRVTVYTDSLALSLSQCVQNYYRSMKNHVIEIIKEFIKWNRYNCLYMYMEEEGNRNTI